MNYFVIIVFVAFIGSINATINTTNIPETSYLFSFFESRNESDGLRIAYSTDGYKFEVLNNDKPLLMPKIGDKVMRDPCLLYGPDNIFHLVWTTSWFSKEIGYASSKDLKTWSDELLIPVMHYEPQTVHSWAPEIIYDSDKKHYLIFWSSAIIGKFKRNETDNGGTSNRIYSTTTTDFKTFTPTKLHYDGGFNSIDATLLHDVEHNEWLMFIKDEDPTPPEDPNGWRNIRMVTGKTPDGPWGKVSDPLTGHYHAEGPTSVKVGKYYHVYFDRYMTRINKIGLIRSTDLKTWEDISSQVKFPIYTSHGTVLTITPDIVNMLVQNGLLKSSFH